MIPRRHYLWDGPGRMIICWRWLGRYWLKQSCPDWISEALEEEERRRKP